MQDDFFEYNRRGIYPLPEETFERYEERARALPACQNSSSLLLKELYDIAPSFVPVHYSNQGLSPLEAGCTWMDEDNHVSIQLRKSFEDKERLFGLYSKEEVLAHELVHAVRYPLGSDTYEEFFAYYLSSRFGARFRAFLGPLFHHSSESKLFLCTLLAPMGTLIVETTWIALLLLFLPPLMVTFLSLRLIRRWYRWFSCKNKIGLPLMVRLTDEEIEVIHKKKSSELPLWLHEQKASSFRWRFLYERYCEQSENLAVLKDYKG